MNQKEVWSIVQNSRRRVLLNILNDLGGKCSLREAVRRIAEKEGDGRYDSQLRKSILVSLTQTHLPKMERMDLIDYDKTEDTVQLQDVPTDLRFVLEAVERGDIPWSVYYLFLSLLGLVTGLIVNSLLAGVLSSCFLVASIIQMIKSPGSIGAFKDWLTDVGHSITKLSGRFEYSTKKAPEKQYLRRVVLLALSVMAVGVTLLYFLKTTSGFILLVLIPLVFIIYNESKNIYKEAKKENRL